MNRRGGIVPVGPAPVEDLHLWRGPRSGPGHDASIGLTGCHPRSLAMQHAAVTGIGRSRSATAVPIMETLAGNDLFHPKGQRATCLTSSGRE